jgi:hypothetical protein
MNEDALFKEYSTNRALQAVYPSFESYRDFMMSQMPAQANEKGLPLVLDNTMSNLGTIKDLSKNYITNKIATKAGLSFNPIGLGGLFLDSIRGLNDKIQQTDFARSKNLMDYLDAKKYGGIDARNQAAQENMLQANVLQQEMAMRPSSKVSAQDAARGNIGTRSANTSAGGGGGGISSAEKGAALHG